MGTIIDEPVEHWAPPDSLDPTPVWKQYLLVASLFVVTLVVVVVVGVTALAPQFVTPPAIAPGDRLVLAASEIPAVDMPPKLIGTPIVDDARTFYLIQPEKGQLLAVRASWIPKAGGPTCDVKDLSAQIADLRRAVAASGGDPRIVAAAPAFVAACPGGVSYSFDRYGRPRSSGSYYVDTARGLDQYLVSVSGDRVIVNLSRVIEPNERTNAPVPTGIPQPQATP